jgi:hypothetical protein
VSITLVRHSAPLTASTWSPRGARIGWDIIPTAQEQQAVNVAASIILGNALFPTAQHPITRALRVLERAVQ